MVVVTTLMIVDTVAAPPPTLANTVVVTPPPPMVSVITDCAGADTVMVVGGSVLVTIVCSGAGMVMVVAGRVSVTIVSAGAETVTVVPASLPLLPLPTVTVTTSAGVVGLAAAESETVIVLTTADVSEPEPMVVVITDTAGKEIEVESVTVLVRTVSEIVIVTTDSEGPDPGTVTLVSRLVVVPAASGELVALGVSPPLSPPPVAPTSAVELAPPTVRVEVVTAGSEAVALNEAMTDEEIAGTSVSGHTIVVRSITLVTSIVDTAPTGSEVSAEVSVAAGQSVIVATHEIIVETDVTLIVNVVKPTPAIEVVLAKGGTGPLVVVLANGARPVPVGTAVPRVEVLLRMATGSEAVAFEGVGKPVPAG